MTRYADPEVYACPACQSFFLRHRVASFNFAGVKDWSDGAPSAWWAQQPLLRCASCHALFWLADLEPAGVLPPKPREVSRLDRMLARWRGDVHGLLRAEQDWNAIPEGWKLASRTARVELDDIVCVLNSPEGLERDRLLWLRRSVWWRLNDRYRVDEGEVSGTPLWDEAGEHANMLALLSMLEQQALTPEKQVEKAELLRLLGRFEESVAVAKAVPPDGYNEVRAIKIERLARARSCAVHMLGAC